MSLVKEIKIFLIKCVKNVILLWLPMHFSMNFNKKKIKLSINPLTNGLVARRTQKKKDSKIFYNL